MRVLMKVNMPDEAGNKLAKSGKLEETIKTILAEQKPEAVYFEADGGMRTALVFVDMKDSSEIPKYAEPWFLATNAEIEMTPVMAPEDLAKGAPDIMAAAKKYG
jgi:hypothetical protein